MKINERKIATIIVNTIISLAICWMLFSPAVYIVKLNKMNKNISYVNNELNIVKNDIKKLYLFDDLSSMSVGIEPSFKNFQGLQNVVKNYSVKEIKIGDLKVWDYVNCNDVASCTKKRIKVGSKDNIHLTFLKGQKQEYEKCYTKIFGKMPENYFSNQYDGFIKQYEKEGYNIKRGILIVDKNNNVLFDLHKATWLYYKYGADYKIKVLQVG